MMVQWAGKAGEGVQFAAANHCYCIQLRSVKLVNYITSFLFISYNVLLSSLKQIKIVNIRYKYIT